MGCHMVVFLLWDTKLSSSYNRRRANIHRKFHRWKYISNKQGMCILCCFDKHYFWRCFDVFPDLWHKQLARTMYIYKVWLNIFRESLIAKIVQNNYVINEYNNGYVKQKNINSFGWVKSAGFNSETESFLFIAQDLSLSTRYRQAWYEQTINLKRHSGMALSFCYHLRYACGFISEVHPW